FVLDDAIQATSDSRDMALENSGKRAKELETAEEKEEKARESVMSAKEIADRKKSASAQKEQQKKIPSLYRPGEKHQSQSQ
ncbi:MAG: hypothetical protein ACRD4O_15030, partial [Bryobacteraceae bacterium]